MKHQTIITFALFCLLHCLIPCARAEPFRIGVSAPLTGELSEYGVAVRRGFELAAAEAKSSSVNLFFEDNQYDARQSISAYRRLKDHNKIDLLFSWGEPTLHAIAPIVEREKTPTIAMSVDTAPAKDKQWILLSVNPPADFISVLQRSLAKAKPERIGMIVTDDPFTRGMYDEFIKSAEYKERTTLIATVSPLERDFKSTALKVSRPKFDAIGVFLLSGQVAQFYRELERTGFSGLSFGTDVFESTIEIKAAGPLMQGAIFANIKVPDQFRTRYVSQYRNESQLAFAYNGYIVAKWLFQEFKDDLNRSAESILSKIKTSPRNIPAKLMTSSEGHSYLHLTIVGKKVVEEKLQDLE